MLQGDEAMIINRRNFIIGSAASCAALAGVSTAQSAARPLPILPMTDLTNGIEDRIALELAASSHDFGTGAASSTLGINNSYLGPVLR